MVVFQHSLFICFNYDYKVSDWQEPRAAKWYKTEKDLERPKYPGRHVFGVLSITDGSMHQALSAVNSKQGNWMH